MSSGNNLPTYTEVLLFALQIVRRAETAAEAKFGLRKCCVSAAAAQRQTSGRRQARQSGKARDRSRRANGEGVQECGGSGSSSRSASPSELWRGAGQCDDLVPHHLYSHMAKPRPGPKLPSCKGMPPAVLELKEP